MPHSPFQNRGSAVVARVKGSWTQYELRALWREDDSVLQFLAFPDIRVAEDRRAEVYEAIGLVNEQLWIGHFELWSSSGILLYRHAALVDREETRQQRAPRQAGGERIVDPAHHRLR